MSVAKAIKRWVMIFDRFVLPREEFDQQAVSIPTFPPLDRKNVEDSTNSLRQTYSEIDAKASSVLTHISIMLAGLFFLFGQDTSNIYETIFFGFELLGYLVAALFLIRCLLHFEYYKSSVHSPLDTFRNDWMRAARIEVVRRITYLNWSISITFTLTALLLVSAVLEIFNRALFLE